MLRGFRSTSHWLILPLVLLALDSTDAQFQPTPTRRLITQAADNNQRLSLTGNVRPEANAANDRGPVPDSLLMEHLQLILRLPKEKEAELERFLEEVQNRRSPEYHKWLTPQEFKEDFSLAPEDIETITKWLQSEGFRVNAIGPMSIDFSGTAGQAGSAFDTEIHYFEVKGVKHIANVSDPQIPAALAPAISGIVSLNDFKPRPLGPVARPQQ